MRKPSTGSRRIVRTSLRLSLQFSFLYSLLTSVIFVGAYWMTDYEIRDWIFDQMESDASRLSQIYAQSGTAALIERINTLAEFNFENSRIISLTEPQGQILAGNLLSPISENADGFVRTGELNLALEHKEDLTGYWVTQQKIGSFLLLQGAGDNLVAEVLEVLGKTLALGFVIVMGLGLLVGIRVGRVTENRIAQISGALDRVSEGDLTARAPGSDEPRDDLARVSGSINATLDQLQALLESQQQITTDIAHDLRTPLQRLRQRLERMQLQPPPRAADTAAALQETEEIISTFNALLRIAQIEAGDRRERFETVDLNEIIETVFEAFEPTADDATQTLRLMLAPELTSVSGDRDLLMQLAANLVENALRHCPTGSQIDIGVNAVEGKTSLWVSDNGVGLASEDTDKVFRRFYRGEKSRTSPGHGLGLTTVKAIADLHEASITMSDNRPGLRVSIAFPDRLMPQLADHPAGRASHG